MPRVISGKSGGIVLDVPKGIDVRPTADKVKEALFSILSKRIYGSRFLDVFAGTGQIGIEALSRGAASAVFFDCSKESVKFIKSNLKKTNLENNADVVLANASTGIAGLERSETFDIVFIDPPYDISISAFRHVTQLLVQYELLAPDALVILEHRAAEQPDIIVMNLKLKRSCKYGSVMVSFYDRAY